MWAELCTPAEISKASVAADFWPWALQELAVTRLCASCAAFAGHVALRFALTMHADLACKRAEAAMRRALPSSAGDRAADADARLQGLLTAPLMKLLLSLAEVASASGGDFPAAAVDSADEALEAWVRFLLDVLSDESEERLKKEISWQVARAMFACGGLQRYGKLHLQALGRVGATADNIDCEDTALLLLLSAVLHPDRSLAREKALADLRAVAQTGFDPLLALSSILQDWPPRKVVAAVVHVMPRFFDLCTVTTPAGRARAAELDCRAPPLVTYRIGSPLLKSVYCAFCSALVLARSGRMDQWLLLRRIVDIVRGVEVLLHPGADEVHGDIPSGLALADLLGAFLYGLLAGDVPVAGDPGLRSDAQAALVSVSLLLRSLRQVYVGKEGKLTRTVDCERWLQRVEGFALSA
eukprot:TRINITY_DN33942_c0_g1_i2.p1 TRINITY_DN33942_c0_g1~~TRINITY_DN33942_c0_g1_i2.p1  ORF type:complete len:412 (-),score=58.80 TRINITY_DN33942_c0_g1_i2:45-1280(-)